MKSIRKYFRIRSYIERLKWMRIFSDIVDSTYGKNLKVHSSSSIHNSDVKNYVSINKNSRIHGCELGNDCKIFDNVYLLNSTLGEYTYVSMNTFILRAKIGKFCSIASHVYIGATPHPMDRISTHPFVYSNQVWKFVQEDDTEAINLRENTKTEIGNDVWIGQGALIMPNIKIGHGAIIGAHSVVTKNVEPYSVVVGNPAKTIKQRFDKDTIEKLLKEEWWNWSVEKLQKKIKHFSKPNSFFDETA